MGLHFTFPFMARGKEEDWEGWNSSFYFHLVLCSYISGRASWGEYVQTHSADEESFCSPLEMKWKMKSETPKSWVIVDQQINSLHMTNRKSKLLPVISQMPKIGMLSLRQSNNSIWRGWCEDSVSVDTDKNQKCWFCPQQKETDNTAKNNRLTIPKETYLYCCLKCSYL